MDRLLSDFLMFVATIDPMGTLAIFVGLTAGLAPAQRNRVAFRAVAYSAAILVAFIGVGQILLGSLGIRLEAFQLAGGIIFFLFGVQMVFGVGAGATGTAPEPAEDGWFPGSLFMRSSYPPHPETATARIRSERSISTAKRPPEHVFH